MDKFFFEILPYLAVTMLIVISILRYQLHSYSFSSLSSQFLENRLHFWSLVPFHYGLIVVLLGHLLAFLIPRQLLLWNSHPLRLFVLELSALAFAILLLIGLVTLMVRRRSFNRIAVVTNSTDWIIYLLLLLQTITGIGIAVFMNWGSSWFASLLTPYLWSLLILNPEIHFVSSMPLLVKLHIITSYLIILVFPFTRLVHVLVIPFHYFTRQTQVVRWNFNRKRHIE